MASALTFARDLMTLSDARTNAMLQSIGARTGGGGGDAEVLARIAGLEARIAADAERRTLEDAHRAQLAAKDTEIADLKRQKEDAERDAEREPAGSMFEPGTPILEQLPILIANGVAAFATKNPEMAANLAASVYAKVSASKANPGAPPAPAPPLALVPAAVSRETPPRRMHVVPPREDPTTPRETARAADPVPPPQAAQAVPPVP